MEPMRVRRRATHPVRVGTVTIGGDAPIVIQSMTDTDTADVDATTRQILALATAGSELVRVTVNGPAAAASVPEIRRRLDDAGCSVPLVGDFHYNGHLLLRSHPECAAALAKYRINPGNVGTGGRVTGNFHDICAIARDHGAAVRVGVNGGSLDRELVAAKMQENADRGLGRSSDEIVNECMVLSALRSTELAFEAGLGREHVVISCKVSRPPDLIAIYRELSRTTRQPLHLGLTEAGMGRKGIVWSTAAMAVLLAEGIGDTIRLSLTPQPEGDRCEEVRTACDLLQALGLRTFMPAVTACPGCGRTTSITFQKLAERVEAHVQERMPTWRKTREGVEQLTLAVMGCVVNGPGESRAADIGISLPGTGESPKCPVFVDGQPFTTLEGGEEELARAFLELVDDYVANRYPLRDA